MIYTKSILFVFVLAVSVSAQVQSAYSVVHDLHEFESVHLKEKRRVLVHVPNSYKNSGRKYPVVYMLDGHTPHPEMMAGIIANQSWGGIIPEMILVSIRNTDRNRDMLPTRVDRFPTSGGADKFLDFIQKEVFPLVEKNYRVEPYKIFAGHSFSGLTVVYTLVNRPDMFDSYIAASPTLQYDDDFVVKQAKEKLASGKVDKTIYLALGDEPDYLKAWNKMQSVFKKVKGLDYEFSHFKDDTHLSVVLPAYYRGLLKIYDGYRLSGPIRAENVVPHYKRLSKRFGYEIAPPEDYLNASGYFLMCDKRYAEALKLFKQNAEHYPNSANVYDSLGECYERMGREEQAAENYRKAIELARKSGNQRLLQAASANLERVLKKSK